MNADWVHQAVQQIEWSPRVGMWVGAYLLVGAGLWLLLWWITKDLERAWFGPITTMLLWPLLLLSSLIAILTSPDQD